MSSDYINWMLKSVLKFTDEECKMYNYLCNDLAEIEFNSSHPMDENRANDGLKLRNMYKESTGGDLGQIEPFCSVLEMLVALSKRIEHQLMRDPLIGDRTKRWFFEMIDNLGLSEFTNDNWKYENGDILKNKIDIFLKRKYNKNGKGGLFPVKNVQIDQRNVQIWDQLSAYLNQNYMKNDALELYH